MSGKAASGIFIVAAKRTPFGAMGGKLSKLTPTELGTIATNAAIKQAGIDPKIIDDVFFGNVGQSASDTPYLGRHVGLKAGIPIETPGLTVNRLCGSGFESVVQATKGILLGESKIAVAGGAENMSMAPYVLRDVRQGTKFPNNLVLEDIMWANLNDSHVKMPMGVTADKVAKQNGITREEADKYALRSQHLWQKAHDAGLFNDELCTVEIAGKKGKEVVSVDEYPRGKLATLEAMQKLAPVFSKDGVTTAANSSGINDGAGCLIVASEAAVKEHGLTPLARVVSWSSVGVDPTIMGIGPVPAIRNALKAASLRLDDLDLVEINEAFAGQYLSCEKQLGLDREKANLQGGAIAVGHPTGASGSRVLSHLTYELRRTGKRYGVGSACCGGGMGIAVVLERC